MQETEFPFEILIHDDASTDGTEEIIREYHAKYPLIIKPLYEQENQWVKGKRGSVVFNFPRARGKYTALCEGDDYWTDPGKLQRQVDYLDTHTEAAGCFTDCSIVDEAGAEIKPRPFWCNNYAQSYNQSSCLLTLISSYGTATLLFRSTVIEAGFPDYFLKAGSDFLLDLAITEHGSLDCLPGFTSAYRLHKGGIWQGTAASENDLSMVMRICLLYQNESFRKKHKDALDTRFQKSSAVFYNTAQREHFSLYHALSLYLSTTLPLRPLRNFPVAYEEVSKLFRQRWRDDMADSHPLFKRLVDVIRLSLAFPDVRGLCFSELYIFSISSFKRRLSFITGN
jgi:glycosyltransferase involved in cell wall biosynthesis